MPEESTPEEVPAVEEQEATPDLGDAGKKAIAAERKRADTLQKELNLLKAAADERANAELTDLERFKKENDELRASNSAATLEALRIKVAVEKGLPIDLAARLQGADYNELSADADVISGLVSSTKQQPPRADLSQGVRAKVGERSPADEFAELLRSKTNRG